MIFYNKYKKFRIENNIDLKDISKRTKIDLKYLQALERGKFAEIPPVYVKLFIKAKNERVQIAPKMKCYYEYHIYCFKILENMLFMLSLATSIKN